jgi:hypothetical protein
VLVTIDGARSAIEAVVQHNPITACQAAMIFEPHVSFFAAYGSFAALEAGCFARIETAAAYALRNPILLIGTALVDAGCMAWRKLRRVLGKPDRRAKCKKSGANERSFHGDISLGGGGFTLAKLPIRAHIHGDTGYIKVLRGGMLTLKYHSNL